MTAFDDRFYHTLVTLAAGTHTVQMSSRQLADLLDVSDRTIRDSQHRLSQAGRIRVEPGANRFEAFTITLTITTPHSAGTPLATDLTGGLRYDDEPPDSERPAERTFTRQGPAPPKTAGEPTTPSRDPDPGCPVCDGTGWVFLPQASNTVEPCRCLSHDYRAWWRAQRRRTLNSWPRPPGSDEPPSKSDYNATMLEWNRRQVKEADALRKAVDRHPATPPDPDPAF